MSRLGWILEMVRDGIRNLMRHRLRSLLTLLGVVFGSGAVVAMLGIGEGAQRTVLREIASMGLQNIYIDSVEASGGGQSASETTSSILRYGITRRDVDRITTVCPGIVVVPAHLVDAWVACRGQRISARTFGVSPEYLVHCGATVLDGRIISPTDLSERTRVAWITQQVYDSLRRAGFIERDSFTIGPHTFKLAGIIRLPSADDANTILIPFTTAQTLFGGIVAKKQSGKFELKEVEIGRVLVRAPDEASVPRTATLVQRTMEMGHTRPDYKVSVPLELLRSKQRSQRILNGVLISIASISLLVGGIGIMNIMLAIVTERIPEIGLRRAIGARRQDILMQFLVETVTLSTVGGIAGCLLGWVGVRVVSAVAGWAGVITPLAVALSLGVSWAVGVVFGLAPAIRAARMDPVKALRYE